MRYDLLFSWEWPRGNLQFVNIWQLVNIFARIQVSNLFIFRLDFRSSLDFDWLPWTTIRRFFLKVIIINFGEGRYLLPSYVNILFKLWLQFLLLNRGLFKYFRKLVFLCLLFFMSLLFLLLLFLLGIFFRFFFIGLKLKKPWYRLGRLLFFKLNFSTLNHFFNSFHFSHGFDSILHLLLTVVNFLSLNVSIGFIFLSIYISFNRLIQNHLFGVWCITIDFHFNRSFVLSKRLPSIWSRTLTSRHFTFLLTAADVVLFLLFTKCTFSFHKNV